MTTDSSGSNGQDEARLDELLAAYSVPPPSAALRRRIVASAPAPVLIWNRARLWWSGLGLAGIGLTGALAGAAAIAIVPAAMPYGAGPSWPTYEATAFGDLGIEQDG